MLQATGANGGGPALFWCRVVFREGGLGPGWFPSPREGVSPIPPAVCRPLGARSCPPSGAEGGSPRPAAPGVGCWRVGGDDHRIPALSLSHFMGYRPAPLSTSSAGVNAAEQHKRDVQEDFLLQSSSRPRPGPSAAASPGRCAYAPRSPCSPEPFRASGAEKLREELAGAMAVSPGARDGESWASFPSGSAAAMGCPPASGLSPPGRTGAGRSVGGRSPPVAGEQSLRLGYAALRPPSPAPPNPEQVLTSKSS